MTGRLSDRMWWLLTEGEDDGYYGSPRSILAAIVLNAAANGVPLSTLQAWLQNGAYPGGEYYREKMWPAELARYYREALVHCRKGPLDRPGFKARLGEIRSVVLSAAFRQQGVLLAHVNAALATGGFRYCASYRRLAESASVSSETARRHSRSLMDHGILFRSKDTNVRGTTGWRIAENADAVIETVFGRPPSYKLSITVSPTASHAAFSWGSGLDGPLWNTLHQADGLTVDDLTAASPKKLRTIQNNLLSLERMGLARRDGLVWYPLGGKTELDAIAEQNGGALRGRLRSLRYENEREGFRIYGSRILENRKNLREH